MLMIVQRYDREKTTMNNLCFELQTEQNTWFQLYDIIEPHQPLQRDMPTILRHAIAVSSGQWLREPSRSRTAGAHQRVRLVW